MSNLDALETKINYKFSDRNLLITALTHVSMLGKVHNMDRKSTNQRLEYLGDAILYLVIGELLFIKRPDYDEGNLTKARSNIVNNHSLSEMAKKLDLGRHIEMDSSTEKHMGRRNEAILADTFEALMGAIFLDAGYEKTHEFINKLFIKRIEEAATGEAKADYKTRLQECVHACGITNYYIKYHTISEKGDQHCKTFRIGAYLNNTKLSEGVGKSKKEAQQNAAKLFFENMKNDDKRIDKKLKSIAKEAAHEA